MKNRAKCKLCESIIESFHRHDYVTCKCGEISVDGGEDYFKCSAIDWNNFLRIDDEGNEVPITIKEKEDVKQLYNEMPKPTYDDLIKILEDMIKNIDELPPEAMVSNVTQYDLMSLMMILLSIFKAKKNE